MSVAQEAPFATGSYKLSTCKMSDNSCLLTVCVGCNRINNPRFNFIQLELGGGGGGAVYENQGNVNPGINTDENLPKTWRAYFLKTFS